MNICIKSLCGWTQVLDHMAGICLTFKGNCKIFFPTRFYHFTLQLVVYETFNCSISLPIFSIVSLYNFSQFNRYVAASSHNLNLNFFCMHIHPPAIHQHLYLSVPGSLYPQWPLFQMNCSWLKFSVFACLSRFFDGSLPCSVNSPMNLRHAIVFQCVQLFYCYDYKSDNLQVF